MNTLLGFGILILVLINFGIYHKFITSFYTDFAGGCATELFWIAIFTAFEIAIIKGVILKILSLVGAFLGFVGKLIVIVLVVCVAVFIISKILQVVKGKVDTEGGEEGDMGSTKSNRDVLEKNISNVEMDTCANCGNTIKKGSKFCQFCGNRMENNT